MYKKKYVLLSLLFIGADRQDFSHSFYKVKMLAINVLCLNKNVNNVSLNFHCNVETT